MDKSLKAIGLLNKHLYKHGGNGLGITDGNVYLAVIDAIQEALDYSETNEEIKPFKVLTYTLFNNDKNYTHWSEGLKMVLAKGSQRINIEGDEIKEIIKALPRTIGGSYK